MTWLEIAERAEKAEGPDRELDCAVAEAMGHGIAWKQANYTMEMFPVISWQPPHPYAGMREPCPAFSGSLDAMQTIIAQTMPEKLWGVGTGKDGPAGAYLAQIRRHGCIEPSDRYHEGATPALALLAALARALEERG